MFITLLSIFFCMKTSLGSIVCSERLLPGLSDDKITASSMYTHHYRPASAKLNSTSGYNWCKADGDKTPYIQVKMNATTVGGIITQGHFIWSLWVERYHIRYSKDGVNWTFVKEPFGSKKVFVGNSDQNTWVTNTFNARIRLRILRIYPIKCHRWCCLRFDVIGCNETDDVTATEMTESVNEPNTCSEEIQATPIRSATGVMTMTAMTESVQELSTFTDEIQPTSTRLEPSKKELSTLIDVLTFASSTSPVQYMASMSPTNCETLNEGNVTTEPQCYMACSKNHTEQELVEMVDKLKQELRTNKKKTSMYVRSKTSASDERKSSAAIGCVGVAILCAVGIGILLLDVPHLVQFLKHIKVNKKVTPAVRA